ncbi:hypothetical protein niasHS_004920 [Heterodera schachtii]|uniref:DUF7083 domain-containing protein n=1 Tax=Heterodera schachtii TaxID=97005 RepID=A0ABD2K094_HETSC
MLGLFGCYEGTCLICAATTAKRPSKYVQFSNIGLFHRRRLDKFNYDPETGHTFEAWLKRYGQIIVQDGKDLQDKSKVQLLIGKLGEQEYKHYTDSIDCFQIKQSAHQDISALIAQINSSCENADLALTKEELKCMILIIALRGEFSGLRQKCLQRMENARSNNKTVTLHELGEESKAKIIGSDHLWKQIGIADSPMPIMRRRKSLANGLLVQRCPLQQMWTYWSYHKGMPKEATSWPPIPTNAQIQTISIQTQCLAVNGVINKWWIITVEINGIKHQFNVDSGAQITLISALTWEKLGKPQLSTTSVRVKNCNEKSFSLKGAFKCQVSYLGRPPLELTVYVSSQIQHDLLGIWEFPGLKRSKSFQRKLCSQTN